MGGQRGTIRIPEGRGGWCWHKFSVKLRKVSDFFLAMVGCGLRSSSALVKKDGKEEGPRAGLVSKGTSLSYAEVLRLVLVPVVGGRKPRTRAPLEEPCTLDLFLILRRAVPEDPRTMVDCSLLESIPVDPPDMDKSLCSLGKQRSLGCSA